MHTAMSMQGYIPWQRYTCVEHQWDLHVNVDKRAISASENDKTRDRWGLIPVFYSLIPITLHHLLYNLFTLSVTKYHYELGLLLYDCAKRLTLRSHSIYIKLFIP